MYLVVQKLCFPTERNKGYACFYPFHIPQPSCMQFVGLLIYNSLSMFYASVHIFKHAPWDWLCEHFQGLWPSLCCLDFLGSYYIAHPSILTTHGWLAARTAAMGGESWIVSLHLWKRALPWLSFLLSFLPFLV